MDSLSATEAAFSELSAGPASDPQPDTATVTATATDTATETTPAADAAPATQETPPASTAAPTGSEDPLPLTGNIPVSRHQAVLAKQRAEAEARIAKLAWAEKVGDPTEYQERLEAFKLAETSPLEFLARYEAMLAQNPQYAGWLQARRAQAPSLAQPLAEDKMPEPNVDLEDGRRLYDAEGLKKLLDWQERRISTRFNPLVEKDEKAQRWEAAMTRNAARLDEARSNWEGFKENEAAIAEYMAADKRRTLESSWRDVVIPKLKADKAAMEADMRTRLIAELNLKGKASTEVPGRAAAAAPKSYKGMATADIVAETFRELAGS